MGQDQIKGMLDRGIAVIVTMFLGWCVKKGYMGDSDAATLTPAIVLLPSLVWGWWNNRQKALLQRASTVVGQDGQKTVIIASPDLANSTPETNIVSANQNKVVPK